MPPQSNTDYQKLLHERHLNIAFLEESSTQDVVSEPSHLRGMPWPWVASTLVFAALWVTTLIRSYPANEYGAFEKGFSNELAQAAQYISIEKVKFTGTLYYAEDGTLQRTVGPDQPRYVGQPSPEIEDANWAHLVRNRYIPFRGGDDSSIPSSLRSEAFHDPSRGGMYMIGIDAYHTLHCLNMLRMEIDHEYYRDDLQEGERSSRLHVEHCLDYVRQMIECKADLTPLPVYFSPGGNRTVPDFDRVHVCRNTERLREWMDGQTYSALLASPLAEAG